MSGWCPPPGEGRRTIGAPSHRPFPGHRMARRPRFEERLTAWEEDELRQRSAGGTTPAKIVCGSRPDGGPRHEGRARHPSAPDEDFPRVRKLAERALPAAEAVT